MPKLSVWAVIVALACSGVLPAYAEEPVVPVDSGIPGDADVPLEAAEEGMKADVALVAAQEAVAEAVALAILAAKYPSGAPAPADSAATKKTPAVPAAPDKPFVNPLVSEEMMKSALSSKDLPYLNRIIAMAMAGQVIGGGLPSNKVATNMTPEEHKEFDERRGNPPRLDANVFESFDAFPGGYVFDNHEGIYYFNNGDGYWLIEVQLPTQYGTDFFYMDSGGYYYWSPYLAADG